MEIKGKITIFPEVKSGKNGEFIICKGTISSKDKEKDMFFNKSVEVKFDKEKFPREKVNSLDPTKCYQLEITSGYLVVDGYMKEGKMLTSINLFVSDGKLVGTPKEVNRVAKEQSNPDLPF